MPGRRPSDRQRRGSGLRWQSAGNFELNVMLPVLARNLLESIRLLASVCRAASRTNASTGSWPTPSAAESTRCPRRRSSPRSTPTSATRAPPRVVKQALAENKDLRTVVLEFLGLLDEETVDRALDVLAMTHGGIIG